MKSCKLSLVLLAVLLLSLLTPAAMAAEEEDGEYSIGVDIVGGSGKAFVSSPALMTIRGGRAYARLVWSSDSYDYMVLNGEKYLNLSEEGANSSFVVPITAMDAPIEVIGDTTAMGTPYEVHYLLTFHSDAIDSKSALPQEAAKRVGFIALGIIVGGGILNYFVKRKLQG